MFKIYCTKCGEKLADGSKFCTKCGTPVTTEAKPESTVVERFEKDAHLQEHWIKRVVAYVIDSIIVSIATGVLAILALVPFFMLNPARFINNTNFQFAVGGLSVIYFIIAETSYGTTIGKNLMGLKVVTTANRKISIEKAFIRNISKVIPGLPILDVIGGLIASTDLHQKYSDKIANTTVISITDSDKT
ncbi:MAG: hypothetical protein CW691_01380 [Candidatus Bathyarchaeum sp.]|nr:MAG: hypothetical protein CW691_01380 [Candidatus Bathyarchaeum sp.]